MARVCFVDTSILCDLLRVPGKCQDHEGVRSRLAELVEQRVQLVLPIAAVIETGNHIAQAPEGNGRREVAQRFVDLLRRTAAGSAPWVLHSVPWDDRMLTLLCDGPEAVGSGFVELAGAGTMGAGDIAILAERELYLQRTAGVEVEVWTHDVKLAAFA